MTAAPLLFPLQVPSPILDMKLSPKRVSVPSASP